MAEALLVSTPDRTGVAVSPFAELAQQYRQQRERDLPDMASQAENALVQGKLAYWLLAKQSGYTNPFEQFCSDMDAWLDDQGPRTSLREIKGFFRYQESTIPKNVRAQLLKRYPTRPESELVLAVAARSTDYFAGLLNNLSEFPDAIMQAALGYVISYGLTRANDELVVAAAGEMFKDDVPPVTFPTIEEGGVARDKVFLACAKRFGLLVRPTIEALSDQCYSDAGQQLTIAFGEDYSLAFQVLEPLLFCETSASVGLGRYDTLRPVWAMVAEAAQSTDSTRADKLSQALTELSKIAQLFPASFIRYPELLREEGDQALAIMVIEQRAREADATIAQAQARQETKRREVEAKRGTEANRLFDWIESVAGERSAFALLDQSMVGRVQLGRRWSQGDDGNVMVLDVYLNEQDPPSSQALVMFSSKAYQAPVLRVVALEHLVEAGYRSGIVSDRLTQAAAESRQQLGNVINQDGVANCRSVGIKGWISEYPARDKHARRFQPRK